MIRNTQQLRTPAQPSLLHNFDMWCAQRNAIATATHQLANCAFAEYELLFTLQHNNLLPTPSAEAYKQAAARLVCNLHAILLPNSQFNEEAVASVLKDQDVNVQFSAYNIIGIAMSLDNDNFGALNLADSVLGQCEGPIPAVNSQQVPVSLHRWDIPRLILSKVTGDTIHAFDPVKNSSKLVGDLHKSWREESLKTALLSTEQKNELASNPITADLYQAMSMGLTGYADLTGSPPSPSRQS